MTDREAITRLPDPDYQLKQASSYNRATVEPGNRDWFANADFSFFVRVENYEGRREFVLMDEEGPGAIVRWWMTFWRAENGILRIYLDNNSVPELEGKPFDLISGQALAPVPLSQSVPDAAPLNERGHNLYLPIPFASHIKVTYQNDSLAIRDGAWHDDVFYNICYRKYPAGTKVASFSMEELKEIKPQLDQTAQLLLSDFPAGKIVSTFDQSLLPGDSLVITLDEPDAAVSYLSLSTPGQIPPQALRSTVLSISFDERQTVWVPVGEFFGTGYQPFPHKTWYNQTGPDNRMLSSWLMPYQKECRIAWINYGQDAIRLQGEIGLSDYRWKSGSLYFGACWHEYHHLKTRSEQNWFFDVNFVNISGIGYYVGDQVTLFNMANTWWGEGDEKIFVDGEKFPSSIGTGSEDYYGYAFAHPEPFSNPFISEPSGAGNFVPGMTVNMRHRSLDAIPFNTSISSNIEMWHWASTCINYAMTSYYYVRFPFETNIRPDIPGVMRPVALTVEDFYKSRQIKVAMAQIFCLDGDRSGNFERIENAVAEAKDKGAEIVTFPETAILGWVNPDAHQRAFPVSGQGGGCI